MSDAGDAAEPRRSQRERKQASHFVSVDSQTQKRKRSRAPDDEGEESPLSDLDEPEAEDEDADVEEDYDAPKPKPKLKQTADKPPPKKKGPPAAKRPKTTKYNAASSSKQKKTTGAKRGRKPSAGAAFDAEQVARDTRIANDNALFNAIMNPSAALQSIIEDFLESLSQTIGPSLAELINCILRACGCNHTLDADEVVDYDGVVDALDNITEALKQDDTPIYPLTSKLAAFKKFRKSLSELLLRLISSAATLELLYTTDLLPTIQTWVVAMSSSHLRSFRHTATVVAMEIQTALCEVAAAVEKEAEIVSRQREGERKRKQGKGNQITARDKELESKAAAVRERKSKLADFLKEFVDGVFVHRYRDLDPNIRAECVRAMGLWFSKYPAHFLDGAYLRYVGWVLSDANTQVRLEAVKALSLAYEQNEYITVAALQHFTERFKPRLVEMALSDTELSVRVAVVEVLQAIDGHGLLEDEQRDRLCLLVFDEEVRMRRVVGGFVKGVWEEAVNDRLVGKKPDAKEKNRVGVKALAMLLVHWGRALDRGVRDEDTEPDDGGSQSEGSSKRGRRKEIAPLVGFEQKSRTALAVEALWDEVEPVSDWETILDILILDHSAPGDDDSSRNNRKRKGKTNSQGSTVDEAWRLEEVEEGVLLEVLLASLRKTKLEVKKGEEDIVSSDITRALIKVLPTLFVKYQTDPGRMSDVLQLPQLMNLDMYLEMRMMTAYSSLWDDVIKQFTSHSAAVVLNKAVAAIRHMMEATSLSNTNSTKIVELEEELSTSLRDAIAGRDELELASFTEDEVHGLTATCARLATLAGTRDITSWMEEDEGGKQSSAWDIISAIAERGRLGYREEELMIDQALNLLTLYIMWKARGLTAAPDPSPEEVRFRDKLKENRDVLLNKLLEFAVGTQSNTSEGVRRAAFQNLMNIHILFCPAQSIAADGSVLPTASLALSLDDEAQYRCAGFVQAEIERYAEELEELTPVNTEEDEASDEQAEDRGSVKPKKGNNKKGKQSSRLYPTAQMSRTKLEREYIFLNVIATFLRAIRAGAIHFRHTATLLAHYGRLGPSFDLCVKVIVDILREEGMYKENGETVVAIILQALRDSFMLYLDGIVRNADHSIALGKVLATCFLIRGAQLAVVRRLDGTHVVNVHNGAINYICKRLASYESANNKKARNKALVFFKVLSPMLTALDSRDALKIKAHLDQVMAQTKITPMTSNTWDPYHAYVRRLTSSKEKAAGSKGRKGRKGAKTADAVGTTTDEEDFAHDHQEMDGLVEVDDRPKPRPRRRGKAVAAAAAAAAATASTAGTDTEHAYDTLDEGENPFLESPKRPLRSPSKTKLRTPVRRRGARARARSESVRVEEAEAEVEAEREGSLSLSEPPMTPEADAALFVTPQQASRKRPRTPDEDEGEGEGAAGEEDAEMSEGRDENGTEHEGEEVPRTPVPKGGASQETTANEIQIRRKRVRH